MAKSTIPISTQDLRATKVFVPEFLEEIVGKIANFGGIDFSFASELSTDADADFILFSEKLYPQDLPMNIAFLEHLHLPIRMEEGGILFLPEELESPYITHHAQKSFHRIIPYPITPISDGGEVTLVTTEWGNIVFASEQGHIAKRFDGLQMLMAQMGVYEEAFFDFFLT